MKLRGMLKLFSVVLSTLLAAELIDRWLFPEPDWSPERLKQSGLLKQKSFFHEIRLKSGPREVRIQKSRFGGRELVYPINSLGLRGAEPQPRRKGVPRIAVLGGSSVFDVSSAYDLDWLSRVSRELAASGRPVEFLNFGLPGALSPALAIRVFTELFHYEPDYVVLSLIFNDLSYFHLESPLFLQAPRSTANPFVTSSGRLDRWFSEHSHLYAHLRRVYLLRTLGPPKDGMDLVGSPPGQPLNAPTARALAQYRHSVEVFVDSTRNIGAVPILMVEPAVVSRKASRELLDERLTDFRDAFTLEGFLRCYEGAWDSLREIAGRKKVELYDFHEEMAGRGDLFVDHMHYSPGGRDLVVERFSALLRRTLDRAGRASRD